MTISRMTVRTRLAVGLTLSTVMITLLVGVVTAALAFWRADDPAATTKAGAANVVGVTVLVVAEDGADTAAADARRVRARVDAGRGSEWPSCPAWPWPGSCRRA